MLFFYDQGSRQSGVTQFNNFLDNQIYLSAGGKNLREVTNYQLLEIRKAIQRNSTQIQSSINDAIKNICGSMDIGFVNMTNELYKINSSLENINDGIGEMNWRLNEINEGVAELHKMIDWKTDLIIEQQKISNSFLALISKGVFLSEKKKLNIEHAKKGNLLLQSAIKEGRDSPFYGNAMTKFYDALENDKEDYISLMQLGFIHYFSEGFLNIEKAEVYFNNSATYALAFSNEPTERDRLRNIAASSLSMAGSCNYILNKPIKAVAQMRKAIEINPDKTNFKFQLAKYLAATGGQVEAASILKEIIQKEKLYCIEIIQDQDLITKPAIQNMLDEVTKKAVRQVEEEIARIKQIVFDERTRSLIYTIEHEFTPKTYVSAVEAKLKLRIN